MDHKNKVERLSSLQSLISIIGSWVTHLYLRSLFLGALSDPPIEVEDFDKEELHEIPFEYLDDIFNDVHINNITPIIPSTPFELQLVHPKLIDWDQQGQPILDIFVLMMVPSWLYLLWKTLKITHL